MSNTLSDPTSTLGDAQSPSWNLTNIEYLLGDDHGAVSTSSSTTGESVDASPTNQSPEEEYVPGTFEGPEKTMEVIFHQEYGTNNGLRELNRDQLDKLCADAKCAILSHASTSWFDAYVLSESSLFIYTHRLVMKTCGTTTLLRCLATLLQFTDALQMRLAWVGYSRKNFLFPSAQIWPHENFGSEMSYIESHPVLTKRLQGEGQILGPVTGDHWFVYTASAILPTDPPTAAAAAGSDVLIAEAAAAAAAVTSVRGSTKSNTGPSTAFGTMEEKEKEEEGEAELQISTTCPTTCTSTLNTPTNWSPHAPPASTSSSNVSAELGLPFLASVVADGAHIVDDKKKKGEDKTEIEKKEAAAAAVAAVAGKNTQGETHDWSARWRNGNSNDNGDCSSISSGGGNHAFAPAILPASTNGVSSLASAAGSYRTLNMMMFEMDPTVAATFFQGTNNLTAQQMTKQAGIQALCPNARIDETAFSPCGYSMNAVQQDVYYTIHITPEAECSYVSFETNLRLPDYQTLITAVLSSFRPKRLVLTMFGEDTAFVEEEGGGGGGGDGIKTLPTQTRNYVVPVAGSPETVGNLSYRRTTAARTTLDSQCQECMMACYALQY